MIIHDQMTAGAKRNFRTFLLDCTARLFSLHSLMYALHARLHHVGHYDAAISPVLAPQFFIHVAFFIEAESNCTASPAWLRRGLLHQVRDYQLGSNVLRRGDTASSEVTQILVPHVDVLGLDRGDFAFDLADSCLIVHVHQHRNNRRPTHLSQHLVQTHELTSDLRRRDKLNLHRREAHTALFLCVPRYRHPVKERYASR